MQRHIAALAVMAAALGGCQARGDPAPGSPAYQPGSLGNGGFGFDCDDSVACDRYTKAAKTFPDAIALSSKFRIRYIPKESGKGTGVVVGAVGRDYVTVALDGLTAIKAGFVTITARNAQGSLVEFTTVPIERPDAIVVYDASYSGQTPSRLTSIKVGPRATKSLRALARAGAIDLGGSLEYEWVAGDPSLVDVTRETSGKVTLTGLKAGSTSLNVAGGTFETSVQVEVTP